MLAQQTNEKPNITIFIESLAGPAGAERSATLIAKSLIKIGYNVNIIVVDDGNSFYEIPKKCRIIAMNLNKLSNNYIIGFINNIKRIFLIKKILYKNNIKFIISFTTRANILAILSCFGIATKCYISQHSPSLIDKNYITQDKIRSFIWILLSRIFYRFANKSIFVSQYLNDYTTWVPKNKKYTIYNPLPNTIYESNKKPEIKLMNKYKYIVGMGRLINQKGFDLLIKSFSIIENKNPEWRLVIIGDGDQGNVLKEYSKTLGVFEKIIFCGKLYNPFSILVQCQIFVLSSRWEAFGNVITEAMSLGLPVISFDCPGGPREIIDHKVNGLLVKPHSTKELANTINQLINDDLLRNRIKTQAIKVNNKYSLKNIGKQWNNLLLNSITK